MCVDLQGITTPVPDGCGEYDSTAIDFLFTRRTMDKYEEIVGFLFSVG